jgi:protein-S-isoprenylcysteine O-methyltransferase Ste14
VVQVAAFLLVSVGLVALSLPSLRDPRSHGFYRFFAFEAIMLLIVLNASHWFRDPFMLRQLVSWFLLAVSLFLAVHGFYLLRTVGKPEGPIENTSMLVTRGAYGLIRHPLYSSLLFFSWGAFLKDPSAVGVLLLVITLVAVVATARVEERENLARFGDAYAAYMSRTRMFIPFLF